MGAAEAEAVEVADQSYGAESVSVEGVHWPSAAEDVAEGMTDDTGADDEAGGGTAASWLGPAGTKKNCERGVSESWERADENAR